MGRSLDRLKCVAKEGLFIPIFAILMGMISTIVTGFPGFLLLVIAIPLGIIIWMVFIIVNWNNSLIN